MHEKLPNHPPLTMPVHGIIPPMVTPLTDTGRLDVPGMETLIEHMLVGGVAGLFVLGTTGEAASVPSELRKELIERTCRQVDGRAPVFVGITDTSLAAVAELGRCAADSGADAVVLAPPFYYPITQQELYQFVVACVDRLALPLFVYNIPPNTRVDFAPETVERLIQLPQIHGLKDSSHNLDYLERICQIAKQRSDWTVLVGPEELLLQARRLGAHGGVCGGANLFPRIYVRLSEIACTGPEDEVQRLDSQVRWLCRTIYALEDHPCAFLKGIKAALAMEGICREHLAPPLQPLAPRERQRLVQYLYEFHQQQSAARPDRFVVHPQASPAKQPARPTTTPRPR
ncbi:MAG: dihydrodipicolinate synthase family protein [Sedimentisphaerales bacterium]|nr:dihydrodipicolinate synthase family protein [Sedimentisphaerales bacterium]